MIIEIPEPGDYETASLNLLNLGWDLAAGSMLAWAESDVIHPTDTDERRISMGDGREIVIGGKDDTYSPEERSKAEFDFWARSQPALGNALAMVQQAVELALKGRVARVSPFLLIIRDPRDYPKGSTTKDISFSAFRTIDAADLLRVHDTVCPKRLGADFAQFWDGLRRERNLFIHSGSVGSVVKPTKVMAYILYVNEHLFAGKRWFERRLYYLNNDELQAAYLLEPAERYTSALQEFQAALNHLPPKFSRHLFGYDHRSRRYMCIHCYDEMNRNYNDDMELCDNAQLRPKSAKSTTLHCVLCERDTEVMRQKCVECGATVLCAQEDSEHYGECMSCHQLGIQKQDEDKAAAAN